MRDALFWLATACPVCGARPPIKIPPSERVYARTLPPDQLRGTWRCSCGRILPITAAAYAKAA